MTFEELKKKVHIAEMKADELVMAWDLVRREAAKGQNEIVALRRERDGEVWYWQGDGADNLESLTCPVLIEADDLRALVEGIYAKASIIYGQASERAMTEILDKKGVKP